MSLQARKLICQHIACERGVYLVLASQR